MSDPFERMRVLAAEMRKKRGLKPRPVLTEHTSREHKDGDPRWWIRCERCGEELIPLRVSDGMPGYLIPSKCLDFSEAHVSKGCGVLP